jgi:hypothetical protein
MKKVPYNSRPLNASEQPLELIYARKSRILTLNKGFLTPVDRVIGLKKDTRPNIIIVLPMFGKDRF